MSQQGGYAAHLLAITAAGALLTGTGDGDFFNAEHDSDETEPTEGADGYIAMSSRPKERLGTIEITLAQTSLANNELEILTASGLPIPIQCFNPQGAECAFMGAAMVKKAPGVKYGQKAGSRVWVFTGKLRLNRAGFSQI